MAQASRHARPPEICPVCGAGVPPSARACPECGADERAGWNPDAAVYDGLDLPEPFSYDEFVRREFGRQGRRAWLGRHAWLGAAALLLVLALLAWWLR